MRMGIIQTTERPISNKRQRREEIASFIPSAYLSWDIGLLLPWDRELYHYFHASQVFGLGLNYSTGFPGFPSCQWQIVGLLSLHNHLSQSFLHDIYLSMESSKYIVSDNTIIQKILFSRKEMGYLLFSLSLISFVFLWYIHIPDGINR